MKLSVVIVNYNVEFFLDNCLQSVEKAVENLDAEVYVVDNNSVDGSVEMVQRKYPWVKLIDNQHNVGFSKANNQAIRESSGEYVLLLNPDTVVEEDTFTKVVDFMDSHPDAGGLGVKMVDGKGKFLPESKRGLPTPKVAFFKISGIYRLQPRSAFFNRYYMGNLGRDEVNKVEILSGAFMLLRSSVLDQVGLLDEEFFMYGEDIDLSWRIIKGGYHNYYYPDTRIIHYKGESTKKGSLNYVFVFYNAMVIFARKHFSEKNARIFQTLINLAIYFRATLAIVSRFARRAWLPLLEFIIVTTGLFGVTRGYETWQQKLYDETLVSIILPIYSAVWITSLALTGAYDKRPNLMSVVKGTAFGLAVILIAYSLLPESLRFSRAIILIGTVMVLLVLALNRILLSVLNPAAYGLRKSKKKRFAIVGQEDEIDRVSKLLHQTNYQIGYEAKVSASADNTEGFLGHAGQLEEIIRVHNINEVIFCARDLSSRKIISLMSAPDDLRVDYKIAPPESLYIIGSSSIDSSKDLFILDVNSVFRPDNRRKKRIVDVLAAFGFILLSPILIWFVQDRGGFLKNCFAVISGSKTWVGFHPSTLKNLRLPKLKNGVIFPIPDMQDERLSPETIQKLNVVYAKDYRWVADLGFIFKGFRYLGR